MNTESVPNEEAKTQERRDSWGIELGNLGRRTRFQVNRVVSRADVEEGEPLRNNREENSTVQINGDLGNQSDREENDDNESEDDYDGKNPYDTKYAKSFRHLTREALPRLDNYRNVMSLQAAYRPTLDELHNAPVSALKHKETQAVPEEPEGAVKFGWIQGVLIRNLLNIWGVMLFLRLSWVIGQAGIGQGCLLILATSFVTTITALSMSAISTNGVIKGGGTYYMISRSLGPEFGGSIGLIFSLANAVACAMYIVGFCESLQSLLSSYDLLILDGSTQDMRILGCITIIILLGIVIIGMEWEAKAQLVLLVILLIAICDFFIGAIIGPKSDLERARGFIGFNAHLMNVNFKSDYRPHENVDHNFFSVMSIFFPAATGILAGANISGDLRDPQSAIPKGTLLSIAITTFSYLIMAVFSGVSVQRDASGNVDDLISNSTISCAIGECKWGLQNSFSVMELVSGFGPIIYAGCFAATLSSALASLVSAPKVFQALCKDKLYPKIGWFARGYGKNNEPVRGYILTFFIAIGFILIGNLNAIAPLISNFFLAAYALINFSTFHASLAKPVGWRPMFRYYNMWLSLTGAILCVGVMFLISWWTALITLAAVLALYLIVAYRKPVVNWGSTTQAQTYRTALTSVIQLMRVEDHVKNYRPQILVLTGFPGTRPTLIDFAYLITKNMSLLICGHIIDFNLGQLARNELQARAQGWLQSHRIKAFYTLIESTTFDEGARILGQCAGIGKLRPNIVLLGFKQDWRSCPREQLASYFETIHKAMDIHMAVCILRVQNGLDFAPLLGDPLIEINALSTMMPGSPSKEGGFVRNVSTQSFIPQSHASSISDISSPVIQPTGRKIRPAEEDGYATKRDRKTAEHKAELYRTPAGSKLETHDLNKVTQFICRQSPGTIDVWWLYDDGGLTLLLPYIINTRSNYRPCKLRVFTLANKKQELEFEQRSMASMLAKFRIDYSDLKVIPDITKKPQPSTTYFFENLIQDLRTPDETPKEDWNISDAELLAMNDKTNRHLRLREMMLDFSSEANLIVMTLPMPRKSVVSAGLYMAWLEVLTKDMPPFLLVRGNQTSVLTFYS